MQARMSSGSRNAYALRMSCALSPAASIDRTCSTARRLPLTIGLPPNTAGLEVMRRSSSGSFMTAESYHAPRSRSRPIFDGGPRRPCSQGEVDGPVQGGPVRPVGGVDGHAVDY